MKVTTCLECMSVFEDMNPGDESIEYPEEVIIHLPRFKGELPIIKRDDGTIGYGCPECKTDGCLADNLYSNAMTKFILEWAKIPTNYNPHCVSIVEANNEADARELVKRHWEQNMGLARTELVILAAKELKWPEIQGRIISNQ